MRPTRSLKKLFLPPKPTSNSARCTPTTLYKRNKKLKHASLQSTPSRKLASETLMLTAPMVSCSTTLQEKSGLLLQPNKQRTRLARAFELPTFSLSPCTWIQRVLLRHKDSQSSWRKVLFSKDLCRTPTLCRTDSGIREKL